MKQEMNSNWDRQRLKNPHQVGDKKSRVQTMFSRVAGSYDLVNRVVSLNLDRRWRRKAVRLAQIEPGHSVLDICCGTGDMALTFAAAQPRLKQITGVDFVEPMLEIARQKEKQYFERFADEERNGLTFQWLCCDAENISLLDDAQYDRVSCVFGVRNLQAPQCGLNEMCRLLKPGGVAIILEFDLPPNILLRSIYQMYFQFILPALGSLISRDRSGAYRYLPKSVHHFKARDTLSRGLAQAGFIDVDVVDLSFGTVLAFVAVKKYD